ncbi:MAG: FAD-dependent oxidoreductase [Planctomycetota bacterium]|nr:FAD-dependent oxidoreductase [Planctomycetota bacterium]
MTSSTVDVVIAGGGVAGHATAWELSRRDLEVLVIDRHRPGRATSASAGGLWPIGEAVGLGCGVIYQAARTGDEALDQAPESLPDTFRDFLVESNSRFPDLATELQELTGIDIELDSGPGLLFLMQTIGQQAVVDNIARGLPDGFILELLSPADVAELEPAVTTDVLGGALLPGENQVNPMLLAEAYKRAALASGTKLQHDRLVDEILREGDRVVGVRMGDETIHCGHVVNAAGAWAGQLAATANIPLPVEPIRGQVVLTEALPPVLSSCLSTSACYLAQKRHGEILIGSTTEHVGFDTSITEEGIRGLCRGAVTAIPSLADIGVKRTWAGLRPGTPDELPVLGPVAGITGYSNVAGGFRTGIVAAPLMARVTAQDILGETHDVPIAPYLNSRFDTP